MASHSVQSGRPNANFHKYHDAINTVVKDVMYTVFRLLYKDQYEEQFLHIRPNISDKDNPDELDIISLYRLLQCACGLLSQHSNIWKRPATQPEAESLEHALFQMKELRNTAAHEESKLKNMTRNALEDGLNKIRELCEHILRKAGIKANTPTQDVNDLVTKMKKNLEDIKTKPIPSGITVNEFGHLARSEMAKYTKHSPIVDSIIFPLINSKGAGGCYRRHLKQFALWKCENMSFPRATILTGESGTGKTSICR